MSVNPSLQMYRGDVKVITFALTITEAGVTRPLTPSELTGVTVRFTAKRNKADLDAAAVIALTSPAGGVVVDPFGSAVTVTIPAAATAGLSWPIAALDYDIQITDNESLPHTLVVGRLSVDADVTRTV